MMYWFGGIIPLYALAAIVFFSLFNYFFQMQAAAKAGLIDSGSANMLLNHVRQFLPQVGVVMHISRKEYAAAILGGCLWPISFILAVSIVLLLRFLPTGRS